MKKFLLLIPLLFFTAVCAYTATLNIKDFGAVGDGITDDTMAFWKICEKVRNSAGAILLMSLLFQQMHTGKFLLL